MAAFPNTSSSQGKSRSPLRNRSSLPLLGEELPQLTRIAGRDSRSSLPNERQFRDEPNETPLRNEASVGNHGTTESTETSFNSESLRSRAARALKNPPRSFEEYQELVSSFTAGREPKSLNLASDGRVLCISDMHLDCKANMKWLDKVPKLHNADALIVAGDVCTGIDKLKEALVKLLDRFRYVFFVVGNHELWTYKGSLNSVQKLIKILLLCEEIGVHVSPAYLGSQVAVVPLQGWYGGSSGSLLDTPAASTIPSSKQEMVSGFDSMCMWPSCIGDPNNPNNSMFPRIANFFLGLNERVLSYDYSGRSVLSFGHFVPNEIHVLDDTKRALIPILCCPQISEQVERLQSCTHVFGHSHENTDVVIKGTRFVQNAMGHTNDKQYAESEKRFLQIWPPVSSSSPLLGAKEGQREGAERGAEEQNGRGAADYMGGTKHLQPLRNIDA